MNSGTHCFIKLKNLIIRRYVYYENEKIDIVALYHGLQLQLMIYMDAAIEFQKKRHPEKEVVPAGVFYYRIQDPIVDKTKDKEEAEQAVLKQLKPDGI